MFAKELSDTMRQAIQVLPFFAVIPILHLLNVNGASESMSLLEYSSTGFAVAVFLLALYLAYNMFRSEDDDGAAEYLLSLPIRRVVLFLAKTGPRLLVLFPLMLAARFLSSIAHPGMADASGSLSASDWLSVPDILLLLLTIVCGFIAGVIGRRSWLTTAVLSLVILGSMHAGTAGVLSSLLLFNPVDIRMMPAGTVMSIINVMHFSGRFGWILTPVLLAGAFLPVFRRWAPTSRRAMELAFARRACILVILLMVPVVALLVRS